MIISLTKLLEGRLGPDAEPSNVATGGELEKVKSIDLDAVNTGDVTESLSKTLEHQKLMNHYYLYTNHVLFINFRTFLITRFINTERSTKSSFIFRNLIYRKFRKFRVTKNTHSYYLFLDDVFYI